MWIINFFHLFIQSDIYVADFFSMQHDIKYLLSRSSGTKEYFVAPVNYVTVHMLVGKISNYCCGNTQVLNFVQIMRRESTCPTLGKGCVLDIFKPPMILTLVKDYPFLIL